MSKQDDDLRLPHGPLISRRAVLGGLAAAAAAPWLIQGLTTQAAATTTATSVSPLPRQQHSATLVGNNQVLVVGGVSLSGDPLDDVVLYGPGGSITQLASLNTARYAHAAVLLAYSKVLVLGGYGQGPLASAEIYDPVSNMWTPTTSLLLPRYNHTAIRTTTTQVLVIGGMSQGLLSDTETYNL